MRRFVEGADRGQNALFPECLEDWIGEDNPVRVIDVFVDELELAELGLGSTTDCRPRRALLHLSYSCIPPCGPAILVTQDPLADICPSWRKEFPGADKFVILVDHRIASRFDGKIRHEDRRALPLRIHQL